MNEIKINEIYRHYKGNTYKVIALGKHSETCEDMVVYQSVEDGKVWCRPSVMWFDQINDSTTRFTQISGVQNVK